MQDQSAGRFGSWEGSLRGFAATSLLCLHVPESELSVPLLRPWNPPQGPNITASRRPSHPTKAPPPNMPLRGRVSACEFGEHSSVPRRRPGKPLHSGVDAGRGSAFHPVAPSLLKALLTTKPPLFLSGIIPVMIPTPFVQPCWPLIHLMLTTPGHRDLAHAIVLLRALPAS